jgi:hypothetical protein
MSYTVHEEKVYLNSSIVTKQQALYDRLVSRRDELLDLLELFAKDSNRAQFHKSQAKHITNDFNPEIKEAKRLLMNSKRRFEYNFNKC